MVSRPIFVMLFFCFVCFVFYDSITGFFPQFASTTNLLAQFLVGFAFYLWISISATFFFLQSARREIGIVDGTYTAVGRSKLATLYFALVFGAALLLALVCFGTNLYRTITILVLAQMSNFVFGLLVSFVVFFFSFI